VAAKIREIALEHKIVLMEAPPLARALYSHAELGEEIPAPLYAAVAQVLAYVFQLRTWNPWRICTAITRANIRPPRHGYIGNHQ